MPSKVLTVALTLSLMLACQTESLEAPETGVRSPNAQIQPAPLSSPRTSRPDAAAAGALARHDRGSQSEARSIRDDQPVRIATPPTPEPQLLELKARFLWRDLPGNATPELARHVVEQIRRRTALTATATLTRSGSLQIRFDSNGFPLPDQSEIRSRKDLLGHILVWPKGHYYRSLPLGSLRAVFLERRADVTPLILPEVRKLADGRYLDQPTENLELTTGHGKVALELASFAGFEASSTLLCRFLVELVGADPENVVCESGRLPLKAEYHWQGVSRLGFLVESLQRRSDSPGAAPLAVPPLGANFLVGDWPKQEPRLADSEALRELKGSRQEEGEPTGLAVTNNTELLRYVLIDAMAVAWLAPAQRLTLPLPKGRYSISFRDFLAQDPIPPRWVTVPGEASIAPPRVANSN